MIKKMIIKKARTSVMMCGTEKLKRLMPYTFADMKDADIIITDDAIPEEFIKATEKAGVALL